MMPATRASAGRRHVLGETYDPTRERPHIEAPKEQPPRKLSGKRTARGMNFWKAAYQRPPKG